MDNEITPKSFKDSLSQSYHESIERIVGYTKLQVTTPPEVIKRRRNFWNGLVNRYNSKLLYDDEVDIHTLTPTKHMWHGVIQYWIDTSYLPYNACMDKLSQPECNGSLKEEGSLRSTPFQSIESKEADEYYQTQTCNDNSSSTSVDTAAYILSNLNTTNKVETMAIVEGAKHDTQMNEKCGKAGSTGSETDKVEKVPQNNSDEKSCTKESLNPICTEQVSSTTDNSVLKDTTIKLGHRKKLYTDRDSPVDLVFTTANTRTSVFEGKSNLHPALETNFKAPKSKKVYKKRRMRLSLLHNKLNNRKFSPRVFTRRRAIHSCNNNGTTSPVSTKSGNLFPVCILNNFIEKENPAKSTDEQCMDTTLSIDTPVNVNCNAEINSTNETEEPNDKEQRKMFNNEKSRVIHLSPKVYLKKLSSIQKNIRSNEKMTSRRMQPVVYLKRLSESKIEKYKNHNKTKTYCEYLNPVVCLNRLSEAYIQKFRKKKEMILSELSDLDSTVQFENQLPGSNTEKHENLKLDTGKSRKSRKVLDICLDPVVSLQKLSEFDIKSHMTYATDQVSPSDNSESTIINVFDDSRSDKSTVLIIGCHNSDRDSLSTSSCSVKTIQIAPPLANISNYRNTNNKNGLNKENRELNNSALHKKSKMPRKEYYTCNETDLITNAFRKHNENTCIREKATNMKETKHDEVNTSRRSTQSKSSRCWNFDRSERSYKNGYSSSINASKDKKAGFRKPRVILSVEDDSFKKLIHDFKSKKNFEDSDRIHVNNMINSSILNNAKKPGADSLFRQLNDIKFTKQRHFNESRNDATRVQLNTRSSDYGSISENTKQVSTNVNNRKIQSTVLRFQTKLFVDSDSESSYIT